MEPGTRPNELLPAGPPTFPLGTWPDRVSVGSIWAVLPDARLVGGVVRDLLLGSTPADLDLATTEPPETVMARLGAAGIRVVPTGIGHGTVTAVLDGRPIEITTLRRDVATDGRRAVVAWTRDWREDAARRDFTFNALSLDRADRLYDFFDGRADLAAGLVRFVGEPSTRLAEDALRALRFFRFQSRFGRGEPDPVAIAAIAAMAHRVAGLSAERVWSEFGRLLGSPDPTAAVLLMRQLGVLAVVLPGGSDPGRLATLVRDGAPPDPLLRLAALSTGPAGDVARRLRLSRVEERVLVSATTGPAPAPDADDATLRRMLVGEPAEALIRRTWLAQVAAGGRAASGDWDGLRQRLSRLHRPVFPLSGVDAIAAGASPGPGIGHLLRAVEAWWRDTGCLAGRDACLTRLRSLVAG